MKKDFRPIIKIYHKMLTKNRMKSTTCKCDKLSSDVLKYIIITTARDSETARCQMLAADKYLDKHNMVAAQPHVDICKCYYIQVSTKHWYEHKPHRVTENDKVVVLLDSQICTDRQIPCNKPDIVIREKESDRDLLLDAAIPSDYNIQEKTKKED